MYSKFLFIIIIILFIIIIILTYELLLNQLDTKYRFGGFPFLLANNNKYMKEFYFIHIPKNMGTLIHYNLPKKYNRKYYSHGFLNGKYYFTSRDHILIDDMIKIEPKIMRMPIIAIIRDPLDRFISICNFLSISPDICIEKCKLFNNETKPTYKNYYNFFIPQVKFIRSKHNLDLTLFTIENKEGIKKWFESKNVKLDLSIKMNPSNIQYQKKSLNNFQLSFLKDFYRDDFDLYEKLKVMDK
tara:strand:+ start:7 stop:732 length:726 start_codon:yes stop_codon:yes gene_type:complete